GPTPNYAPGDSDSSGGGTQPVSLTRETGPGWTHAVSPLLEARCGKCHGAKREKGKFRVDSIAALRQGGKEGPGSVPGDPKQGSLLARVHTTAKDERMPPPKEPQLSAVEIELL